MSSQPFVALLPLYTITYSTRATSTPGMDHFSTSTNINMPSVQFNWIWTQLTRAERYAPWCFSFIWHLKYTTPRLISMHVQRVECCLAFEVRECCSFFSLSIVPLSLSLSLSLSRSLSLSPSLSLSLSLFLVDVSCLKLPPSGGMTSRWWLLILTPELHFRFPITVYVLCCLSSSSICTFFVKRMHFSFSLFPLHEATTLRWHDESLMASDVNISLSSDSILPSISKEFQ